LEDFVEISNLIHKSQEICNSILDNQVVFYLDFQRQKVRTQRNENGEKADSCRCPGDQICKE
jgi:hypothetical protein